MKIDEKLDKLLELQLDQGIQLARMEVDLRHHIKRSDQHEKLINRLWFVVAILVGAGGSHVGPVLFKFLGGIM